MNTIILNYLYEVGGYVTFRIIVQSGEFAGSSTWCISKSILESNIETLKRCYNNLAGCSEIKDMESDDYIIFRLEKAGHMTIAGQIGGSFNDQFLKYTFDSDQTYLKIFIDNLSQMIS